MTASEALIDAAIDLDADAILVHHGFFWKGENPSITGLKRNRLKKLLGKDINLFAYHLPIDVHPTIGNNAQLAKILGITQVQVIESVAPAGVVMRGELSTPLTATQFGDLVRSRLERVPLVNDVRNKPNRSIAW